MNKAELESTLIAMARSTKTTAYTLMPDRFNRPSCESYEKIYALLDDDSKQKICIAAPRGIGKSTTGTLAHPLKKTLFREKKFIIPISCSSDNAILMAEDMKRELLTNENIVNIFGPMKSNDFSKESWVTSTGTLIMPRGRGQQIRGLRWGQHRPDLIILDDVEDPETVQSEEQRKKQWNWFLADVMNSVDKSSKNWKIVVIGTVLHQDSLISKLLEDPSWDSICLEICDDNYVSQFPDFMTSEEIRKMADEYREQNKLDIFYMEYRNICVPTEDRPFSKDYFHYYNEDEENLNNNPDVVNIVIIDPAKTVTKSSDFTAIVGIGLNQRTNRIYIRDIVNKKLHSNEIIQESFAMAVRLNARIIGYEVTSLHEFVQWPMRNEVIRRQLDVELVELTPRGGKSKLARIGELSTPYRMHQVYHNPATCGPLEAQLMSFPKGRFDDVADATSYIIQMMARADYYFQKYYDVEDEYKSLAALPAMPSLGDWRNW